MKDNNYSMVEGILYNYPKLKVEIDNLSGIQYGGYVKYLK